MSEDQPEPTKLNGSKQHKISPSMKAWLDAKGKLGTVTLAGVRLDMSKMGDFATILAPMSDMLAMVLTSSRIREIEAIAIRDLLVDAKLCTANQYYDKVAAHIEKYADQLIAGIENAPQLVIARP